ncbi:hypothetical protein PG993_014081 [Apiospora rasikravindrae]|uniref:Transposase n=1 Tax=Apiospora rasikravindrae TaxID=990691 RepID=A0ABR1RS13_9PEZI
MGILAGLFVDGMTKTIAWISPHTKWIHEFAAVVSSGRRKVRVYLADPNRVKKAKRPRAYLLAKF